MVLSAPPASAQMPALLLVCSLVPDGDGGHDGEHRVFGVAHLRHHDAAARRQAAVHDLQRQHRAVRKHLRQ